MLVRAGAGLKNSFPSSRLQPLAARVPGQLFLPGGIFFRLCTSGKLLLQQGVTQDWGGGVGAGMGKIHMEVRVFSQPLLRNNIPSLLPRAVGHTDQL